MQSPGGELQNPASSANGSLRIAGAVQSTSNKYQSSKFGGATATEVVVLRAYSLRTMKTKPPASFTATSLEKPENPMATVFVSANNNYLTPESVSIHDSKANGSCGPHSSLGRHAFGSDPAINCNAPSRMAA